MVLFSFKTHAVTFEEYIIDQDSQELQSYLTGYIDALYDNAYLIGGCPRKLPYRPYGEFFQHIDIYIAKETQDENKNLEKFYKMPVEPFVTTVVLKYISCKNPESLNLRNENKSVQIEMREIARNIIEETQKYASPEEKEKDFQYNKFLDKLKNPKKYEKKCPKCKVCPKFKPEPLIEQKLPNKKAELQISKPPMDKNEIITKPELAKKESIKATKKPEPPKPTEPEIIIEDLQKIVEEKKINVDDEIHLEDENNAKPQTKEEEKIENQLVKQGNKLSEILEKTKEEKPINTKIQPEKPEEEKPIEELPPVVPSENNGVLPSENLASKLNDIKQPTDQTKIDDKVEPLKLPTETEKKEALQKGIDKIQSKANDTKYKLEQIEINFDNLNDIKLPD